MQKGAADGLAVSVRAMLQKLALHGLCGKPRPYSGPNRAFLPGGGALPIRAAAGGDVIVAFPSKADYGHFRSFAVRLR